MSGGVRAMPLDAGNKAGLCCVAFLFPMIPVYVIRGHSGEFYLNIGLWLMGLLPGVIHAWWIISAAPSPKEQSRRSHGERKYDIAAPDPSPSPAPGQARAPSQDGTEVRPFTNNQHTTAGQARTERSTEVDQHHHLGQAGEETMLPPYEIAMDNSSGAQRAVSGGRSVRSGDKGY